MMDLNNYFSIPGDIMLGNTILDTTLEAIDLEQQLNQLLLTNESETASEYDSAKIEDINSKILSVYERQSVDDFYLGFESIPWDKRCVVTTHQGRTPYLENLFKMQFTSAECVSYKMNNLVKNLVKGVPNTDTGAISSEMIDNVSSLIEKFLIKQLNECDEASIEVELYASFISLDRTRSFGPLAIRSNAVLSDKLIDNASRIYVISECLLGGIFFGLRRNIIGVAEKSSFSCKTLQVISKGTISNMVYNDLDASYNNWKKSLLNNLQDGYPISFKVKNLKEIIK